MRNRKEVERFLRVICFSLGTTRQREGDIRSRTIGIKTESPLRGSLINLIHESLDMSLAIPLLFVTCKASVTTTTAPYLFCRSIPAKLISSIPSDAQLDGPQYPPLWTDLSGIEGLVVEAVLLQRRSKIR